MNVYNNRELRKTMTKRLVMFIFFISLLSFISASSLGIFKQNECVNLYQLCDNCTYVNLTSVIRSGGNGTVWSILLPMTKVGTDYNYTFCNTDIAGDYSYNVCGDKNGVIKCENIDFKITPTGDTRGFGLFLVLIIASVMMFLGSFQFDFDWGVFLSGILFILSGVYAMIYGVGNLADLYTRGIAIVSVGLGLIFIVASIFNISKGEENVGEEE